MATTNGVRDAIGRALARGGAAAVERVRFELYRVPSHSRPGTVHTVGVGAAGQYRCDCEAGRHERVCWHAGGDVWLAKLEHNGRVRVTGPGDAAPLADGAGRHASEGGLMPPREDALVRFCRKVRVLPGEDGCWEWTGRVKADGCGTFFPTRRECWSAHRWAYTELVGPIPDVLELDHLCRNRRCVNPDHQEPVTPWENQARGLDTFVAINRAKTHCPRGHPYDDENTRWTAAGGRVCRACSRERQAAWTARNHERVLAYHAHYHAEHREHFLEQMRERRREGRP